MSTVVFMKLFAICLLWSIAQMWPLGQFVQFLFGTQHSVILYEKTSSKLLKVLLLTGDIILTKGVK